MNRILLVCFLSIVTVLITRCGSDSDNRDFRQNMRNFVQAISEYTKAIDTDFIIIPQNGHELLTENGEETDPVVIAYLSTIDGVGREDLFYGYDEDNVATPASERDYMLSFMNIAENNNVEVLVIDYCWTENHVDSSYEQSNTRGFLSFAADHRELDKIPDYPPDPYRVNPDNIASLVQAQNFLYLINTVLYNTKEGFLNALENTDYDLLIIDLFYGDEELSAGDLAALKNKNNGGARMVFAYMSIGEAEDYRYYWQPGWETNPPPWLEQENPDWPGNYKVRYWEKEWQDIIYGNEDSYTKKILDAGFDGVYLDIIDAFEYFENR